MPIRPWIRDDVPAVVDLLGQLNESLGEDQELSIEAVYEHFDLMRRHGGMYRNFVFERDGRVLGFVSVVNYRSVYHKKGTALINELIVARESRGAGIGTSLLRHCIDEARREGMDEVEVGVMRGNEEAIRFYKANGVAEEYLLLGLEFSEP